MNYILIKQILKNTNPPFALLNTLKHFLEKYRFCPKSSNDTNRRGWGRGEGRGEGWGGEAGREPCYLRHYDMKSTCDSSIIYI